MGWKTHHGYRLPSTILQQGEQPLEALYRLLQSTGPFAWGDAEPLPVGLPRLDDQGRLVVAFKVAQCAAAEAVAQAHRRHLIQGQPDVLVAIPSGARYECSVEAGLVAPLPEATLKENSLAFVG